MLRDNDIVCITCKEPFTDKNVFTADGWTETGISLMCEICFDDLWTHEDDYCEWMVGN